MQVKPFKLCSPFSDQRQGGINLIIRTCHFTGNVSEHIVIGLQIFLFGIEITTTCFQALGLILCDGQLNSAAFNSYRFLDQAYRR